MALCSMFCPRIPVRFRPKPISPFLSKPLFSLSYRVYSSLQSTASTKDELGTVSIGFLGIGIMGSPMAQNLIKAGCDVTVWNRTKSKCDPLIGLGAKYKSSPEEVTAACDLTFAMLADPESAIDVACGKNGAVSGISSGKGYVDVSTVDAASSMLISKQIKDTGALFLEAPVSGSKKPAEDGQLIFLTALPSLSRFALFRAQKEKKQSTHTNTNTMLLGKRQRPPINRTTSLSEIKFDLNLPGESEATSNHQQSPSQNPVMGPYGQQLVTAAVDQHRGVLQDQRFLSMVTPRGNLRRHSGDFSDAGHFLRSCSLCERLLVPGRDIYMYRGDTAFCSSECRQQQMAQDERKEKGKPAKDSAVAATAKPGKGGRAAAAV